MGTVRTHAPFCVWMATLACFGMSLPAAGASLCLQNIGTSSPVVFNGGLIPCSSAATVSTMPLRGSQTVTAPDNLGTPSGASIGYSAFLSFGDIGLSDNFSAYDDSNSGNSGDSAAVYLAAVAGDSLGVSGISAGSLALTFSVSGQLSGSGDNALDAISASWFLQESSGVAGVVAGAGLDSTGISTGAYARNTAGSAIKLNFVQDPGSSTVWDFSATGLVLLPFTSGSVQLNEELLLGGGCIDAYAGCSYSADFMSPVLIGGAVVYDTSGNVVHGATVVSSSGYNYAQSLSGLSTPEPASFGLAGIIFACAAVRRKRPLMS